MSPSNVGNFGIGLVELVLGSLFLVTGGRQLPAGRGLGVVWSSACQLARRIQLLPRLFLPPACCPGDVGANRRKVVLCVSRFQLPGGWLLCQLVQCKALAVDLSNTSVPILRGCMFWFGSFDWSWFWTSRLWRMFDRWFDSGSEDQKMLENL
ncbi:hypothetical protein T08_607 [Trichinella sp. T8]|nr:hypothetical protein T08_607 [Trichinella sp. T8]